MSTGIAETKLNRALELLGGSIDPEIEESYSSIEARILAQALENVEVAERRLREIQKHYASSSLNYAKYADVERWLKRHVKHIQDLQLHRSPPQDILDLGCGTGRHAIALVREGYKVTGIDISAGMLEVARRKAAEAGVEVEWIQADAANMQTLARKVSRWQRHRIVGIQTTNRTGPAAWGQVAKLATFAA